MIKERMPPEKNRQADPKSDRRVTKQVKKKSRTQSDIALFIQTREKIFYLIIISKFGRGVNL
jgi:hypothetical protein